MAGRESSHPLQGMRDALRSSLGRSLKTLPELDRLAAAWPVAVGPALSTRSHVFDYDEGELTVRVDGADWIEPLNHMRLVLMSELTRIAGIPVTAIHLKRTR